MEVQWYRGMEERVFNPHPNFINRPQVTSNKHNLITTALCPLPLIFNIKGSRVEKRDLI